MTLLEFVVSKELGQPGDLKAQIHSECRTFPTLTARLFGRGTGSSHLENWSITWQPLDLQSLYIIISMWIWSNLLSSIQKNPKTLRFRRCIRECCWYCWVQRKKISFRMPAQMEVYENSRNEALTLRCTRLWSKSYLGRRMLVRAWVLQWNYCTENCKQLSIVGAAKFLGTWKFPGEEAQRAPNTTRRWWWSVHSSLG